MQRLCGFRQDNYSFEVQYPTTIFEVKQLKIIAYEEKNGKRGKRVNFVYVPLKTMPRWDVPGQCIILSKRDESRLERTTRKFVKSLPILK